MRNSDAAVVGSVLPVQFGRRLGKDSIFLFKRKTLTNRISIKSEYKISVNPHNADPGTFYRITLEISKESLIPI